MPAIALQSKDEIMKDRERERLARYLRVLWGNQRFGFYWSPNTNSWTNGKDIYVAYEVQAPQRREFTATEKRIIRKGLGIHERAHLEYDLIEVYREWQKEWSSADKVDWASNLKYPLNWIQFFGNVMMDGRIENFTVLDRPTTKEYIDFMNYEWTFGNPEGIGEDLVYDFRTGFLRRALGMTDITGLKPEAMELIESVQPLIDQGRNDLSTETCLTTALEIIRQVWKQLMEWMELNNQSAEDFEHEDQHANSQWGKKDEVEQNVQRIARLLAAAASSSESEKAETAQNPLEDEEKEDPAEEKGPDYSNMLRLEQRQMQKDEKEAEDLLAPYQEKRDEVTIHEHREDRKAYSAELTIKPFPAADKKEYNRILREVKNHIDPIAKSLSGLLEGKPDETRRNQKSGKILTNRVWRAEHLGESNIFEKKFKGTPARNARVLLLNDISGSTGSQSPGAKHRIIDEMKKAEILMVEACEKANLPVAAYGFTEDWKEGTILYPFKPFSRFSDIERGFLGGISPQSGNRDTVALQWAVDQLAQYPEDFRVLIMLSDGEPCFDNGEDYETMKSIVLQAEKRGIEIICLYVGPHHPGTIQRVQQMYPGRAIIVSKLAKELSRHIKRIIRKKR